MIIPALIGWAVIPWGGHIEVGDIYVAGFHLVAAGPAQVIGANVNIGVVYMLAVASLGVYGVTLGGWASNNKYSFLGGLRCTAGMISYEIPLGATILAVLLIAGTVRPDRIVEMQADQGWFILSFPLAAVFFYICSLAESNRAPFDNAEAEQELVGGYHTEYSAMRFALFFLAEYAHMITASALLVALFFGGYHVPFIPWTHPEAVGIGPMIVKFLAFFTKVLLSICLMMVIRWTIPRIRYDQVLKLAWGALIPLGIALVVATALMVYMGWTQIWQLLLMNIALAGALLFSIPLLPHERVNRRIPIAGSRFSPLAGERAHAAPTHPAALRESGVAGPDDGLVSAH